MGSSSFMWWRIGHVGVRFFSLRPDVCSWALPKLKTSFGWVLVGWKLHAYLSSGSHIWMGFDGLEARMFIYPAEAI
jgi:hypothetical protein